MKNHIESVHKGKKPFKCKICESKFGHKSDLKRHISVHEGIKPFKCYSCEYECARNNYLKRHIHDQNMRKYQCAVCGSTFAEKAKLLRHFNNSVLFSIGRK